MALDSRSKVAFAVSLRDGGQIREALAVVLPILTGTPSFEPAIIHLMVGDLLDDLGDYQGAVNHLQYSVKLDDASYFALNALGFVYQKHYRHDEAVAILMKAVAIEPSTVTARVNLLSSLVELGQIDQASRICAEGAEIHRMAHGSEGPFPKFSRLLKAMKDASEKGEGSASAVQSRNKGVAYYHCRTCSSVYSSDNENRLICGACGGVHDSPILGCPYCGNSGFLPLSLVDGEHRLVETVPVLCPICKKDRLRCP